MSIRASTVTCRRETRLLRCLAGAMILGAATSAFAHSRADDDVTWARRPSESEARSYAPPLAAQKGMNGQATIRCSVKRSGDLADCIVVRETPAGEQFGAASLRMVDAGLFRVSAVSAPDLHDGLEVTVNFSLVPRQNELANGAQSPSSEPLVRDTVTPVPHSSPPVPPAELDALTPPTGRLAMLGIVPDGEVDLLDLDRISRSGQAVDVIRLTIFARPRLVGDKQEAYEVSSEHFDCVTGTHRAMGARTYDRDHTQVAWSAPAANADSAEPGSADGLLAQQLCAGRAPESTDAKGVSEAVSMALNLLARH
jgi:hypothetical protein